jgi:ATP-dependent Clp protease ATP-binding subunit ClpA/protein subunit release factor B
MWRREIGWKMEDCGRPRVSAYDCPMPDDSNQISTEQFIAQLPKYATDLTQQALDGKLSTAYHRDNEVDNVLRALSSPGELYPILAGGARCGKTTIAHQAAMRIARGECPSVLTGKRVFEITPSRLVSALGGVGSWNNTINEYFSHLESAGAILFVRDFHTAYGMGARNDDNPDLSSAIADLLQGSHPHLLFEASSRGLDLLLTERPTMKSLFATIQIASMSRADTLAVIKRASEDLEIVHEMHIAAEAQQEALELAMRFQVNAQLPGAALDMLKDVLAMSVDPGTQITRDTVRKRFKQRSGLPDFLVSDDAPYDEDATRAMLSQRVFGQDAAVEGILRMIALVRARLNNPLRPMGVFLFLGPTGVGKTELVKALAGFLFGESERTVRFNMADYSYPYSVFQLFGNPNGDTETQRQGLLSTRLAPQPFSVLLLDEFEKADNSIYQRFLQLFDEGVMINGQGEEINLRNTIIVMTSNLGAHLVNRQIGFRVRDAIEEAEQAVMKESETYFRPEFINRLDAVAFFKPLSRQVIRQIAKREISDVIAREGIQRLNLSISVDDSVVDLMAERGFDLRFGARYLKRQIERSLTYPLARQIARKRIEPGAAIRLIARGDEIVVTLVATADVEIEAPHVVSDVVKYELLAAKELRARIESSRGRVERLIEQHQIDSLRERVAVMMDRLAEPDFWRDNREAAAQIEEMNALSQRIDQADNLTRLLDQCESVLSRVPAHKLRGKTTPGSLVEANRLYAELERELPLTETLLCLRTDADRAAAFVTIRAIGDGPAFEWVRDVASMYLAWAQARGFSAVVVDESPAGKGLQQATLNIAGFGAHALLRGESGAHRLIRPADPKKPSERLNIWAQVDVYPDLPLSAAQARDVMRDTRVEQRALRETGVLVDKLTRQAQISDSSRALTWRNALSTEETDDTIARYLFALRAQRETPASQSQDLLIAAQVRTYTLHKQQSVRDTRTNVVSAQPRKVLAGALDEFLLAYLTMTSA